MTGQATNTGAALFAAVAHLMTELRKLGRDQEARRAWRDFLGSPLAAVAAWLERDAR